MDSDDIPEAHGTKHTFNNASSSADVPILISKTLLKGDLRSPERIHGYGIVVIPARHVTGPLPSRSPAIIREAFITRVRSRAPWKLVADERTQLK